MSRMIFPFEEPELPDGIDVRWPGYDEAVAARSERLWKLGQLTGRGDVLSSEEPEASSPIGCSMVVDSGDGWRSVGTLTGVGPVKVDEYGFVSYEVSFKPERTFSATFSTPDPDRSVWRLLSGVEPSRVVHRASSGLRKPRPVDGVAFGWDRSRGMYSEKASVKPQSFDSWWKSFEESQFSWLGAF